MKSKIGNIFRVIVERENALRLLRLALEEMNPRCENCEHFSKYDKGGTCYCICKWKHEDEARQLLGKEAGNAEL